MYSPAKRDGDNAGAVLGDFEEHRHGKVEMGARRVAPAAVVVGQGVIRRAEICGRNEDGRAARVAPLRLVFALNLEAGAAAEPLVEKRRAQRRRVDTVALAVQVAVPTSTPCIHTHQNIIQSELRRTEIKV